MNAFMKTMSEILINDLVEELSEENSRLLSHLLFANKCLLQLKTHLIDIHFKYETIITSQDKQVFKTVIQLLDSNDVKTAALPEHKYSLTKTRNNRTEVRTYSTAYGDNYVLNRSCNQMIDEEVDQSFGDWSEGVDNEDSDESYVANRKTTRFERNTNKTEMKSKPKLTTRLNESNKSLFNTKKCVEKSPKQRNRPFKCDYNDCGFASEYQSKLVRHVKTHSNTAIEKIRQKRLERERCFDATTQSYICSQSQECLTKSFPTYDSFYNHEKTVHSERRLVCQYPDCGKTFKQPLHLNTHHRSHENIKAFKCEINGCAVRCTTQNILNRHVKNMHSVDRQLFHCQYSGCERVYPYSESLKRHVIVVHTTGPQGIAKRYKCSFPGCERRYETPYNLSNHSAKHCSEPTIRCTWEGCPEVFSSDYFMRKHRAVVHLKQSHYVVAKNPVHRCEWPGCDFEGSITVVKLHKTKHTGAQPYACEWPECGKLFRLRSVLRDHMNVHQNVKPYACQWPGCQYKCANSGNLVKHVKQVHQK